VSHVHSAPTAATTRSAGPEALLTTADQVLSSASNALMVFAVAQVSTASVFGIVALLITVVAVCTGFNRGALGTPILLASNLTARQITVESGYALSWSLWTGVAGGVVLIGCGAALHQPMVGLAYAVFLPIVLAQDVLRHTAIGLGRVRLAVAADGLWTATMLVVFIANISEFHESPELAVAIWGVSGLASVVILQSRCAVAPRHNRIIQWWKTYMPARLRFGSVYSISQIGVVLVTVVALTTAGSVAAAGLRGAQTLFGPIGMLIAAMPIVFVPYVARNRDSGIRNHWRLVRATSFITSVSTMVATACLIAMPSQLGDAVLGATWTQALPLIPWVGLAAAAMCWLIGAMTFFSTQGASRAVFWLNLLHIGLQVTAAFLAGELSGGAVAIAIAVATSSCVMAAAGIAWARHHIQSRAPSVIASLPPLGGVQVQ